LVARNNNVLSISVVLNIIVFILSLFIQTISFAQDFTANTLGDYGNVTVMEVTGNYDAKNPDGAWNYIPRQEIAKEFFRIHKDEYDFLVIFSNFDFQMPDTETKALYLGVKNDTQGIGQPIFDNSILFGSNGKLQGIIDIGNISNIVTNPLDPEFEDTLSTLGHEQMHRWGAYVKFKDASGNTSSALLGKDGSHWSFLFDSDASVLLGNEWQDNGNGTFTSIGARKYYSPLDLYLTGFYDKSQVPPMLLIDNPNIDPKRLPEIGITISGTPRYITIDDITAAEGERIPDPSESQKSFKTAFILITSPGTFTGYELYEIENIRNGWVTRFSVLTGGQGIVEVASNSEVDIPTNPGVTLPPFTPRTIPPDIEDGVKWLMNNQMIDGSWMDLTQTLERDTAEVVFVLKKFDIAQQSYFKGLQWLNGAYSENIDYLSRKINALVNSGQDIATLIDELLLRQNPDGGWGSNGSYGSNPVDTSLALKVLAVTGYPDQGVISKAIEYLKSKQNANGGWGSDDEESSIEATANVLSAFNKYRDKYQLEDQISRGIAWLINKQNNDGGFGNSPSTIYDTALAVLTLREFDVSTDITNNGLNYILNIQSENGSWYESPYQTALAVSAVWKATIDPDLSIKSGDITFIPPSIKSLPSNVVINANIWNLGRTDVPRAKVSLHDGEPSLGKKLGEQIIAFTGQASTTVTFSVTISDVNEHRFYISVDPENLIKESNEVNNMALNILRPEATHDFEILPSDITVSQNPVDIFKDVKITSKITNKGTMNAYNVQVKYYIDEGGIPFDIATSTVDIPANSTITNEITWRTNKAGENLLLTVFADPFNSFTELSEENNKAFTYLTVSGSIEPNLTTSYKDMTIIPNPANEGGSVNISALIKNDGFSPASNIAVNFYKGVPGVDGVLFGSQTISSLNPGESNRVSIDWMNIMESGERIIYVQIDSDNQIKEIREDDNDAFITLKILSLPDFAVSTNSIVFTPSAPKDGDVVSIQVTVQNKGEQGASNVPVKAYEGNTLIGSQIIPSISGNYQAGVSFSYDTTGKSGVHRITVIVDPDNTIIEQSDDNNQASRTFGVQDANLWLTEKYISPNGDGVKDGTQFFFRLNAPKTVKIIVINWKGETIRTFRGSEFENTTGGNIIWDGLDDNGMAVDDGRYQIQIVDVNNNILGSLPVIVDNNRSPLTDAIGTKHLMNNNLTCKLPDISDENWEWLPDESGIVFSITSSNIPDYLEGIYTMAPDGKDVLKLLSINLTENDVVDLSSWALSPDGERIAFLSWKYDPQNKRYTEQLWVMDSDGKKMNLLLSHEQVDNDTILDMKWSPDSKYILYNFGPVYVSGYSAYDLWIINVGTLEKTKIDWGYLTIDLYAEWSPDSKEIAYFVIPSDGSCIDELKVSDLSGNKKTIFTFDHCTWYTPIHWVDNKKIVTHHPSMQSQLWLFDASGNGNHRKLSDDFEGEISIAPDRKSIAYISSNASYDYFVNISDTTGNIQILHETKNSDPDYFYTINAIKWSPDSTKISFIEEGYPQNPYQTDKVLNSLIVIDVKTKQKKSLDVSSIAQNNNTAMKLFEWLSDSLSILASETDLYNQIGDLYVIHSETGRSQRLLPDITLPLCADKILSPLGHYLTYYQDGYQTGACNPKYRDLWAMSTLLNLTAELRAAKEKSAVILKGVATDLNFEGYMLEYADAKNPTQWNLISPPSHIPVINDVFTTWVPPYEGTFSVRLTVWDKAGNAAWDRKRVFWGLASSITNLYKTLEIFSPNGDGIKDSVELHYRVLEPVHLEFNIYDGNDYLITTIQRDYTLPVDDYITWDGRDSSGKIVPDGKYKIKVFTYEFFVEVDNTPPDVNIALTPLKEDLDGVIFAELLCHAVDNRIKNWVIEYGEGDNPKEWYKYREGEGLLVRRDDEGNVLNPIQDTLISRFSYSDIEWLVGKKLKISVEDFAGNKITAVTDFLNERIILNIWDGFPISESTTISSFLGKTGHHSLGGLETIRLQIASMNVQYWNGKQWFDTQPVMNPPSGRINNLDWDNSVLNLDEVYAVRIKAVDIPGQEHYSNMLSFRSVFSIDSPCGSTGTLLIANNSLLEELQLIKLQVQSDVDTNYSQLTDYHVYDFTKGDYIPAGIFYPPIPPIQSGMTYKFRMVGIGVSGKIYESVTQYPQDCPVKISLDVKYEEVDCGLISHKAELSTHIKELNGNVYLKTLSYYIQNSEGLKLLRQFDLTKDGWGSVTIDTSDMLEGSYPVSAVLTYLSLDDNKIRETSASGTLAVDRILPAAQITYPYNYLMLCPIKVPDTRGDWYGIPVEGIAVDNTNVKQYELYYGIGENPTSWLPAMTRKGGQLKHISGKGFVKGQIGIWDVTDLKGPTFSLELKVMDVAGNVSCNTIGFSIDTLTRITNLTTDKSLFSPNGDGNIDDVKISFETDENVTADIKVFKLLQKADGSYALDSTPVRTIASGLLHFAGTENTIWDGRNDSNIIVPDGRYGIAVFAKDSCENTAMKWIAVEVDNTPPTTIITYPGPPDSVTNIVEIKGTADDPHFGSSTLEAGQGDNPDEWIFISSNIIPVKDNVLGKWNISGLDGKWTLRLTATDIVGNKNTTTVTIDPGAKKNLIKDLDVTPWSFSPNHDGKLDTAAITYNLTEACQVEIDILDSASTVKKTYITTTPSSGIYAYTWDGKDNKGAVVPDGNYTVKLTVILSSNSSVTQDETIRVSVDTTPPTIDIKQPVNNSYIKTHVTVNGTISDKNLTEYSVTYSGDSGTIVLDQANQSRENYTFGIINDLPEENYLLHVKAKDIGENFIEKNIAFIIDKTPPKVNLETPQEGEYFGADKNIININGTVIENNLDTYSLRYGAGDNPTQWIDLLSGNTSPVDHHLFSWKVGKNDGIPDGLYTISFYVKDKAGFETENKIKVIIDNTPPETSITSPGDGEYIKTGIDIKGSARDQNLDKYSLEISSGNCGSAFKWTSIRTSNTPIKDGILATLQTLPHDGDYCLKLTTADKVGNKGEAKVNIKIDAHPPEAPLLSGTIEDKSNVRLNWTQGTEPDLSGYNLYRDNQKVNTSLIKDTAYLAQNLMEGIYAFKVIAVDLAGNESNPSNEIKLRVDLTGPDVNIRSPQDGSKVSGLVDIKGTAYSPDDFKQYRIYIGQGSNPSQWNLLRTSPVPIPYGSLARWDTISLSEGTCSIKIEAEDISGNMNTHQIVVTIDNTPPTPPIFISATTDGSEVTLTWQANTDPDLAGYLLFRNEQLANVSGIVIGELKPYLIVGKTYIDKSLPDGRFTYYLIAVDQAGNMSDQSNILEVDIDTHPPQATIVEPLDKSRFENKTLIKAETPDIDIASIQFQYKKSQDNEWINLGSTLTKTPYITYIDPMGSGLSYGDYHLRAVATDKGGKKDTAPSFITVTYTDLTAPAIPFQLRASTDGKEVTLTWTGNTEADLNGYNIYRTSGDTKTKLTTSIVKETTYQDKNISDGIYTYEVTAVDLNDNESKPSNSASARIYAPLIAQPYTPTGQNVIQIIGNNAEVNSSVEIYVDKGSGYVSQGITTADNQGNSTHNLSLELGENRITAKATDSSGNKSRTSDTVVVVYNEPPVAPTGLAVSIQDHTVSLAWNPNTESDLSGYNLYRNNKKVNVPVTVTSGNISASSCNYYNPPSNAFDSEPSTCWASSISYSTFNPTWLEIDLPSPELINHIEIQWDSLTDYEGNEILYAGKDYEIQVWSGYAWITQTKVTGNNTRDNIFDFKPSYRTDKIRIYITDTTAPDYSKHVRISEIKILKDNLIDKTSHEDINLHDGEYNYQVTAVDYYGFESLPSDGIKTIIGDVIPPSAPLNLTATVSGTDIILNWATNSEPDLAGYNIYRSTTSGGPYIKINSSPISSTSYPDTGLASGFAYYYVVVAVDYANNESNYSNEVMGILLDTIPPSKPEISFPTLSGIPVVLYKDRTDISGIAEPASTVELFKDSISVGSVIALKNDVIENFALDHIVNGTSLSPDGRTLSYSYNGFIWLKILNTGTTTKLIQGESPLWSPDGRGLTYKFLDSNLNNRIGIYYIETGNSVPLTEDTNVNENSPSWLSDGSKIAFVSNREGSQDIWIKDLISGSLAQMTNNKNASNPKPSPDGERIAYFEYQNLYVIDLLNGETIEVDTKTDGYSLDWAPDSKGLVFVSYRNGNADVFTININTKNQTRITDSISDEFNPVWSPDGHDISFVRQESNGSSSVLITSSNAQGQNKLLQQNLHTLNYLSWIKSGVIAYIDQNTLNTAYLKGHFSFKDIPLDIGENIFHVTATDSSGNVSEPSDEISIVFDMSLMPDLEITIDNIFIYPPYPMAGEEVAINVVVLNKGQEEVRDVDLDIYLLNSSGNLELLKSEKIPSITSGSGEVVGVRWDSNGKVGINTLIVIVDPEDKIHELSETNNLAMKEIVVVNSEEVLLTTTLDSDLYQANQDVNIHINLKNPGAEKNITIETLIEDDNGNIVVLLNPINTYLPYASHQDFDLAWNTSHTYAGLYKVHSILKGSPGVLSENRISFTIEPDINIDSSIITDEAHYGPREDVSLSINIKNNGRNYVVPQLIVKVKIMDQNNNIIFAEDRTLTTLLPAATNNLNFIWNTGLTSPGSYNATVEIYIANQIVSTKTTSFVIDSSVIITGNIIVKPSVALFGGSVLIYYTIQNNGNVNISDLPLQVLIVDPDSQAIRNAGEDIIDLQIAEEKNRQFLFSTQGYGLKAYVILLQYSHQGDTKNIASTSFSIKDGTPPVVNIASPASGSHANSEVGIVVTAKDDASGVDRVEYQMDNGTWSLLPVSDPSANRYSTTWITVKADEGSHTISFRATDKAGNMSNPVSTTVIVESIQPVEVLKGTITARPNLAYPGQDETITYTITNNRNEDMNNTNVKVLIVNQENQGIKQTFETTVNIPMNTTITGNFIFSTSDLTPQIFTVILQAAISTVPESKELARTFFEIKPALEITKKITDVKNLLVWLNDKCNEHQERHSRRSKEGAVQKECIRLDLLERILNEAVTSYFIVYDKKDFQSELSNPYYTDILIIGDNDHLEDCYADELREKVYSGKGLISSLYLKHGEHHKGDYDPILGLKYERDLSGSEHQVNILDSPISEMGILKIKSEAVKVSVDDSDRVVALIEAKGGKQYPGIIMNTYGLGKTLFFAFDLGLTIDDENYEQLLSIIKNSLSYMHKPIDTTTFHTNQLVPVEIEIKSLGGDFDLRITETYPAELKLYDPLALLRIGQSTGQQITENPWVIDLQIEPNKTKKVLYYALITDTSGTYTLLTEVSYSDDMSQEDKKTVRTDIKVDKDTKTMTDDIINELKTLAVSGMDKSRINKAIRYLKNIQKRVIVNDQDIEKNIHKILKAIDLLLSVKSADTSNIRLKLDGILNIWDTRYYLKEILLNKS